MVIEVNKNDVDIPESPENDYASQEAKTGMSPATKFGIVIAGVFGILGVSYFLNQDVLSDGPSNVRGSGNLDGTLGGEVQRNSPRYQELLEQANEEAAQRAEEEGRTFVRTVENVLEPVDILDADRRQSQEPEPPKPEPAPEPEPEPVEPRRVAPPPPPPPPPAPQPQRTQAAATPQQAEENPYLNAMLGQMGSIVSTQRPSSLTISRGQIAEPDVETAVVEAPVEQTVDAADIETLVTAGQILYGETLTHTSSDMAGAPVLVKVTAGELRGARLIGNFAINPRTESMVVNFSSMTLPDGTTLAINAFAVDGMTAESAVASDVNRRYLQRYGPIVASAFISSFATARSETEQTITGVGDETVVVTAARDAEQSLYAGLGAAAGALAENIGASAPIGPEVILRDGYPIAIMFMETVQGQRE